MCSINHRNMTHFRAEMNVAYFGQIQILWNVKCFGYGVRVVEKKVKGANIFAALVATAKLRTVINVTQQSSKLKALLEHDTKEYDFRYKLVVNYKIL